MFFSTGNDSVEVASYPEGNRNINVFSSAKKLDEERMIQNNTRVFCVLGSAEESDQKV
jgi:hypothetical protein